MLGQVEVDVKALQPGKLFDLHLRKDHAADLVLGMRQRQKALGKQSFVANVVGRHAGQFFPGRAFGQLAVGPTGTGLPRDMVTFLSGWAARL